MRSRILPNYCIPGRELEELGGAIIHYFSARNVDQENRFSIEACRNLMLDFNRPRDRRRFYMRTAQWPDERMYASAHVLIGRDGDSMRLVEYNKQAYHAGASLLNGRAHCNRWTLGLELVGTIDSGFTSEQYRELARILHNLDIDRDCIAGHDRVRWTAIRAGDTNKRAKYDPSGRKDGNGDNFQWNYLHYLLDELEEEAAEG